MNAAPLTREQAERIVERRLKYIKKTIKKRIAIYEPLDCETTCTGFLEKLRRDDFKMLRENPLNNEKKGLEEWITHYLVEQAYYALEEYVRRLVMKKMGIRDLNEIRVCSTLEYITERIEKEGLKKIKQFKEKSKFKTFLYTVAYRLFLDYMEKRGREEKQVTGSGQDIITTLNPPTDSPLDSLIKSKDKESLKILLKVMENLTDDEKQAIKMKYWRGMKILAIARAFGWTRYKMVKYIEKTELKIKENLLVKKEKGVRDDAPR
ncbi:MAG: RNA polymerase sigma factor [bacterium]|nr:RNA polymerase sigma factor [bacterium]